MTDLSAHARRVLADNRYLVLGTVDPSGRPRVSPVWFTTVRPEELYWLSSPDAHHSRNLAERPEVSLVVFDSTAAVGAGQAVYLEATAAPVPEDELEEACAEAFREAKDGLVFTVQELAESGLVLYRARVTAAEVHVRGSDPEHGTGIDRRLPVRLAP
jgi:nitroimidazol reductase NimA-like FMN-containing flavoprotein (pyridoxamine 5'-phosphate oxidase superfamily)